jgi:hypothetical protein
MTWRYQLHDLKLSSVIVQTSQDGQPFSRLMKGIARQSKRTGENFEDIVNGLASQASGSPKVIASPPDPWDGAAPEKFQGLARVWQTILLLGILSDPSRLTHDDIEQIRKQLRQKPAPPVDVLLRACKAKVTEQPVRGRIKETIGVLGGAFTDASKVVALLDSLSKLSPPSLKSHQWGSIETR